MTIKPQLEKIKTKEECTSFLNMVLKEYKTLYSRVYSDYNEKDFTKQIKAYKKDNHYIITITNFENKKISEISVCLTTKKPKLPHPVFPIMSSFAPNAEVYTFK